MKFKLPILLLQILLYSISIEAITTTFTHASSSPINLAGLGGISLPVEMSLSVPSFHHSALKSATDTMLLSGSSPYGAATLGTGTLGTGTLGTGTLGTGTLGAHFSSQPTSGSLASHQAQTLALTSMLNSAVDQNAQYRQLLNSLSGNSLSSSTLPTYGTSASSSLLTQPSITSSGLGITGQSLYGTPTYGISPALSTSLGSSLALAQAQQAQVLQAQVLQAQAQQAQIQQAQQAQAQQAQAQQAHAQQAQVLQAQVLQAQAQQAQVQQAQQAHVQQAQALQAQAQQAQAQHAQAQQALSNYGLSQTYSHLPVSLGLAGQSLNLAGQQSLPNYGLLQSLSQTQQSLPSYGLSASLSTSTSGSQATDLLGQSSQLSPLLSSPYTSLLSMQQSRANHQYLSAPSSQEDNSVFFDSAVAPVNLVFRSSSSPVNVQQVHSRTGGTIRQTASVDAPYKHVHTITKPVIHELNEIIAPIRKVNQEVLPMREEINPVGSQSLKSTANLMSSFASAPLVNKLTPPFPKGVNPQIYNVPSSFSSSSSSGPKKDNYGGRFRGSHLPSNGIIGFEASLTNERRKRHGHDGATGGGSWVPGPDFSSFIQDKVVSHHNAHQQPHHMKPPNWNGLKKK